MDEFKNCQMFYLRVDNKMEKPSDSFRNQNGVYYFTVYAFEWNIKEKQ